MIIQISLKRVSFLSSLGFLVTLALACASSGCAEEEPDLGTWTESGDEVLPPADPDMPEEPESLCGTDVYAVDWTDLPSSPPIESGYPFMPLPGVSATIGIVPNGVNDRVDLVLYYEDGQRWTGTVAYGWNRPADGYAALEVQDVETHDGIVTIVWRRVFWGDHDQDPATPYVYFDYTLLTVVDALRRLIGTEQFLSDAPYKTHRVAWDGARYAVAQYDPNFRTLQRASVAYGVRSNWEAVVTLDESTLFRFESIGVAADGTLNAWFRFTEDPTSALRVDHRSCQ